MSPDELSQQAIDQLVVNLPAGYNIAELLFVPTESKVIPEESLSEAEQAILAQTRLGSPPMINTDGRPTILRIVKWMCHAGVPNENGDMFVSEELKTLANDLFRAPNFGVMDWNHAAIIPDGESPPLMGVWYKADYAFNPSAAGGMGAWGVLVTGMMFAWLFPEVADALVAEQTRSGVIKGSMACIPKSVEYVDLGERSARVLHNPVFFTHSLLSRRPADANATGLVSEDPGANVDEMARRCLQGKKSDDVEDDPQHEQDPMDELEDLLEELDLAHTAPALAAVPVLAASTELGGHIMTEKELDELKAAHEAQVTALQAELATVRAELEAVTLRLDGAATQLAEVSTARDAIATALEVAEAQLGIKVLELEQAQTELARLQAEEDARVRAAKLESRIAELNETYRASHAKHPEELRAKIEAHWAELTDEEWEVKKAELMAGMPARVGYVARSQQEGALLVAEQSGGILARLTSHIK